MSHPFSRPSRRRARAALAAVLGVLIAALTLQTAPSAMAAPAPLVLGQSTSLTFSGTVRQIDLSYAAGSGEKLVLNVSQAALTTSTFWGKQVGLQLIRPDGSTIDNAGVIGQAGPLVVGPFDATGTWTLRFVPQSDTTGTITFVGSVPVDTVTNINPGIPASVSYPSAGVDVRLKFAATAGQRLTLGVTDPQLTFPFGSGEVHASAISPSGVVTPLTPGLTKPVFAEWDGLITQTGIWTLWIQPITTLGTETMTVGLVSDTTAAIAIGTPVTIGTTVPGQNASYAFTGTAGKKVEAFIDNRNFTSGGSGGSADNVGIQTQLYGPDGQPVGLAVPPTGSYGDLVLPSDGTYRLRIDPVSDTVGTARLTLRYQAVTTAALRIGASTTATLNRGDITSYTFRGYAGRQFGARITALNLPADRPDLTPVLGVALKRPDGSTFYSGNDFPFDPGITGPRYFETPALDVSGTWTIEFTGTLNPAPGRVTFTSYEPADQTVILTPGTAVNTRITAPVRRVRYPFTGTAGRHPTITTKPGTWRTPDGAASAAQFLLLRPDGSPGGVVSLDAFPDGTLWGEGPQLDSTGTWTLVVDPYQDAVGAQRFTLSLVPDVMHRLTLGKRLTVAIGQRGADGRYTFAWDGQGSLTWAADLGLAGDISLIDPGGNRVAGSRVQDGSTAGTFTGNGASGIWTLLYDPGSATGTGHITLSKAG